jgi:hypothetical protein
MLPLSVRQDVYTDGMLIPHTLGKFFDVSYTLPVTIECTPITALDKKNIIDDLCTPSTNQNIVDQAYTKVFTHRYQRNDAIKKSFDRIKNQLPRDIQAYFIHNSDICIQGILQYIQQTNSINRLP